MIADQHDIAGLLTRQYQQPAGIAEPVEPADGLAVALIRNEQ